MHKDMHLLKLLLQSQFDDFYIAQTQVVKKAER